MEAMKQAAEDRQSGTGMAGVPDLTRKAAEHRRSEAIYTFLDGSLLPDCTPKDCPPRSHA
jgi:hypothetical protein